MIHDLITGLINKGLTLELIEDTDVKYVKNKVIALLGIESVEYPTTVINDSIPSILSEIVNYAVDNQIIDNNLDDKEILSANIMDCFIPRPSVVNDKFYQKYEKSPESATNYFYQLSKHSNYIQTERIKKNISFKADSTYGELEITINLSKPEKDPEQIKKERLIKKDAPSYPKCLLCKENEGYLGRTGYPARANHRLIRIDMLGEQWNLQYSPYVYYNEHCILLSDKHRPMKINSDVFRRILTFTEKFPHYFMGSNADLPIVGGSILSHDHYQGGNYEFPMMIAEELFTFQLNNFPNVKASVLNWPASVIRLQGENIEGLVEAADLILTKWRNYSDETANIISHSGEEVHNTITPIARNKGNIFELDLVLRNNRTTDAYPSGIFHPHQDVHHIKKENIGLIEVMGLAVLPPRLVEELDSVKKYILGQTSAVKEEHRQWATILKSKYGHLTDETEMETMIEQELGDKFARILEDIGVFKNQDAFLTFINELNMNK
ncbi:Galactose-1-phosphate uridylyltransferase [Paraliobacillus sp. PM-2]|uniref:UDP-glucose--hexose-1-phosphate uridylyltransferase n=1 Tax=Paraliobacillus sp. PM-2 TaxID=1462524 RepID=UPI00061C06EF|nr:UDP-glucose--hexose-1-phosphate uridylyltransferase [Paraliobacillus sp. PM-2]CQR47138.1 Galactose-1-phosphate uridylyltransferase [Paraliobacillus sp. PM-2]